MMRYRNDNYRKLEITDKILIINRSQSHFYIIKQSFIDDSNPMKRYLAIIILLLIVLTLAACNGNSSFKPETVIIDPPKKARTAAQQQNKQTQDLQKSIQELNN